MQRLASAQARSRDAISSDLNSLRAGLFFFSGSLIARLNVVQTLTFVLFSLR
jgi:hypothetical protein